MSKDNSVRRYRTWISLEPHPVYIHTSGSNARVDPTSTIDPFVLINSLFDNFFRDDPAFIVYIHLRVSRAAFDLCVACGKTGAALPDLPIAGFVQATSTVGLLILQRWLAAKWTPVGSKLCSDLPEPYRDEFLAPDDAAFVYFLVREKSALGVGGRKKISPGLQR
jgi:hypothetical protein